MEEITVFTKDDFRNWLAKHHEEEERVLVILYKKHAGKPFPSTNELMREAICFGWIDTTVKRLDEERYSITYVKRNKNSRWSDNTLRYAKELIDQGKMTPAGLKQYEKGRNKPTHDHGIPKSPDMPDELRQALGKHPAAKRHFEKFPPSTKKMLYRWVLRAKRDETKVRRVQAIIEQAKHGKKDVFGPQGQKTT